MTGSGMKAAEKGQKREEEVLLLSEEMKTRGQKDENIRVALVRGLRRLKTYREEEKSLGQLLEE